MTEPDANLKGLLTQGFEEFKKTSKDFQAVTSALANYRQTCLVMYEAGSKLVAEMKRLSEHESMNKYMSEIAKITSHLDETQKGLYNKQNQLWEVTLSPLINTEESDLKQNQVTEKQVKNSFQKLDSQLQREKRALVKQNKKKAPDQNMINAIQTKIDTLKSNQADLWLYFLSYKDIRYHKWLSSLAAVADISYNYFSGGQQALSDHHWNAVVEMKPADLPQMTFVEAPKPPPPKVASEQEVKVGETSTLKYGYLVKQGAKVKNWKKRWFVLNYDKLNYYKSSNVAKESPLGEILLNEVRMCELSRDLNKDHCFVLRVPNRDYHMYAESDSQMQEWLEALEKAMPGKVIVKTTTDDLNQFTDNKRYSMQSVMESDPADDWQMYYSDEGQEYWCNEKTGETSWEKPSKMY